MAFIAGPVPRIKEGDLQGAVNLIWERLQAIEDEISFLSLPVFNYEPSSPIEGMAAYADGTNWNPGGGAGLYRFDGGGTWVKI